MDPSIDPTLDLTGDLTGELISDPTVDPSWERTVERRIDLETTPADVWEAVRQPATWLADEGTIELWPGGTGRLVDDGVARRVVVETVEEGERVVFRWWDEDEGEPGASRVEITVLPSSGPTALAVRETRLLPVVPASVIGARARARTGLRWEVRLACLAFLRAPALV